MGTDFTSVAALLANPARSTMVDALFGGRPLAAGELARLARVSLPTASEHLAALVDGGLLAVTRQGSGSISTPSRPTGRPELDPPESGGEPWRERHNGGDESRG